jgi:hypothetical protein
VIRARVRDTDKQRLSPISSSPVQPSVIARTRNALRHLSLATVSLYAYANPILATSWLPAARRALGARILAAAAVILTGSALVKTEVT